MAAIIESSEIDRVVFRHTKWREGYSQAGVDDFLRVAKATLAGYETPGQLSGPPELTGDDVVNVRFQPTKFRPGYDQDQVDDLLDRIAAAIREHAAATA